MKTKTYEVIQPTFLKNRQRNIGYIVTVPVRADGTTELTGCENIVREIDHVPTPTEAKAAETAAAAAIAAQNAVEAAKAVEEVKAAEVNAANVVEEEKATEAEAANIESDGVSNAGAGSLI